MQSPPSAPRPQRQRLTFLGAARSSVFLAACAIIGACGDPTPPTPEIARPSAPETDLARSEAAAQTAERDLLLGLTTALAGGNAELALTALVTDDFRGTAPVTGETGNAGPLAITWLSRSVSSGATPADFVGALIDTCTLTAVERVEVEILRFELATGEPTARATALLRQRWAGIAIDPTDGARSREDVTHYGEVELRSEGGRWRLAQYDPAEDHRHTHGPGVHLRGPAEPIFIDRTDSVGLTLGTSARNKELIQSFIDRHLTLALGGLTVTDFNGDERPDLIATRAEETTIVFLNDGRGGFRPEPFAIPARSDRPAFLAKVDLDGDGLDELVGTEVSRFEGDRAFAGLWTRTPASGDAPAQASSPWRHLPRAFALPNPIGMRRLAVQNVVPFDADGDGDQDLFFAVYGNAASRGEHYNTVEAHDGADNHLLINQGDLRFTEESDARGITGTGYTYVALGFDADHDGDVDLFEGNDFGPNVLWRNDGGRFVDDAGSGLGGVSAYTMGAALADLEADGSWDLYVSNMSSEEGMRMVPRASELSSDMRERVDTIARGNMFYRQPASDSGAGWTEHAEALGLHEGEWAWGCQFVDVDGDGAEEILVTNGFASHQDETLGDWQTYYWRQVIDDGARLERGETSVNVNESLRFQGSFNGHERDRLFVRLDGDDPDRPWVDGGYCLGFDGAHDGRAVVPLDPDGDGDLDLALLTLEGLKFLENQNDATGAWLRLRLLERGASDGPLRPAVGARVNYERGGRRAARHVGLVEGFQSQISTDITLFVEPDASALASLSVRWPDGSAEAFQDLPVRRLVTITKGEGVRSTALPTWESGVLEVEPGWRKLARQLRRPGNAAAALAVGGTREDPAATAVFDSDGAPLRWFRGTPDEGDLEPFLSLGAEESALPHLLVQSGRIALDEARYREALATFRRSVEGRTDLSVSDAPAFEGIARAYVLLGRVDLAEAAYRRSVELDPDYAVGHFNLATAYATQGRFADAVNALREVERIEGATPRVIGAMVENAGSAGNVDVARRYGDLWMAKNPEDGAMLTLLGKVHAQAGKLTKARALFESALEIDERDREAREALNLTLQLLETGGR